MISGLFRRDGGARCAGCAPGSLLLDRAAAPPPAHDPQGWRSTATHWPTPSGARSRTRVRQGRFAGASRAVVDRPHAAGFTLIEIMVVVIIIGLLAVLVAPRVIGRLSTAKDKAARAQVELFGTALDSYRLDNGVYPTTQQGLEALWSLPTTAPAPRNWTGPYLRKRVPADPWGNAYVYRSPGEANPDSYDLVSLGRDGAPGGEGEDADIHSWE